jgi:hypothetical protein
VSLGAIFGGPKKRNSTYPANQAEFLRTTEIPVDSLLALWGTEYLSISQPYGTFLTDCRAGNLPELSFVDPKYLDEDTGTSADDVEDLFKLPPSRLREQPEPSASRHRRLRRPTVKGILRRVGRHHRPARRTGPCVL